MFGQQRRMGEAARAQTRQDETTRPRRARDGRRSGVEARTPCQVDTTSPASTPGSRSASAARKPRTASASDRPASPFTWVAPTSTPPGAAQA